MEISRDLIGYRYFKACTSWFCSLHLEYATFRYSQRWYVTKQNYGIRCSENTLISEERSLHQNKKLMSGTNFSSEAWLSLTSLKTTDFSLPAIEEHDLDMWIQECHTKNMALLLEKFPDIVIFHLGDVSCPPRLSDFETANFLFAGLREMPCLCFNFCTLEDQHS